MRTWRPIKALRVRPFMTVALTVRGQREAKRRLDKIRSLCPFQGAETKIFSSREQQETFLAAHNGRE